MVPRSRSHSSTRRAPSRGSTSWTSTPRSARAGEGGRGVAALSVTRDCSSLGCADPRVWRRRAAPLRDRQPAPQERAGRRRRRRRARGDGWGVSDGRDIAVRFARAQRSAAPRLHRRRGALAAAEEARSLVRSSTHANAFSLLPHARRVFARTWRMRETVPRPCLCILGGRRGRSWWTAHPLATSRWRSTSWRCRLGCSWRRGRPRRRHAAAARRARCRLVVGVILGPGLCPLAAWRARCRASASGCGGRDLGSGAALAAVSCFF